MSTAKTIVLIACCKTKKEGTHKAKELYVSPLFRQSLKYAESIKHDMIFILSAKHHLLDLNKKIEYYDKTLNNMAASERKIWAKEVLDELRKTTDLKNDKFIFLAGKKYREHLLPEMKKENCKIPLEGLTGIGIQISWLKEKIP
jgi:hypothetical protein